MPPSDSADSDNASIAAPPLAPVSRRALLALLGIGSVARPARAHHAGETGDPGGQTADGGHDLGVPDPSGPLIAHDAATSGVVSDGPSAHVTKNLAVAGRGERPLPGGNTDVWALDGYAYVGTFDSPCGTGEGFGEPGLVDDLLGPGVAVFDVHNPNRPSYLGSLPSLEGSRINDVKVEAMNAGAILVHSNEPCDGGPGGFEIYDVDDPTDPGHLASVRIDEINPISDSLFGGITDVGVHNLFLFRQGERDYVSAVAETAFHNFQTWDITDPADPQRVSAWGAEELFDPGVGDETGDVGRVLDAALWLLDGFGSSQNRFLHDVTIGADGTRAYLANWDAGLVLLDVSDPADPQVVSVALDREGGSRDGEVNSHQAWPSEDGSVVVETEEDFSAWVETVPPGNLTFGEAEAGEPAAPLPGSAIATAAGDDFEANQTGNAGTIDGGSLVVESGPLAGNTYDAVELSGDQPTFADAGPVSGDIVWIGRACDGDGILNAGALADGGIAVVRRGACEFREKNFNAADAGADAIVIANDETNSPWGGIRIWDYSDETNPVLASTFDTACSAASDPIPECDLRGTYTVHNVIVEGEKAYVSWYSDGVLVLDISDPYDPVEVARYSPSGADFEEQNGGIQDVWGIYKEPRRPWIYASDRNGGLYVLKELGSGSENRSR